MITESFPEWQARQRRRDVIKAIVLDLIVVSVLGLLLSGAAHMHDKRLCAHPDEHQFSHSAFARP